MKRLEAIFLRVLFSLLLLQGVPLCGETLLERADSIFESGETDAAEVLFQQVIAEYPSSPAGHRGLARVKVAQGKVAEAASILLFLGDGFTGIALYAEAIDALEEAVILLPQSSELRAALGRALMLQGERLTAAEMHLDQATKTGDVDLTTLLYLAAARWELGRLEEAEILYRDTLSRSPGSTFIQYQFARLLIASGRHAEALQLLEQASKADGDNPELQTDLARMLAAEGELERAQTAYRKAIDLAPARKQAHYGLARLLLEKGEKQASRAELEIYRKLTLEEHDRVRETELASLQVGKAWGRLRKGDAQGALELFRELPESDDALLGLASTLTSLGDIQAAIATLERAVMLYPERRDLRLRLVEARLASAQNIDG